MRRWRRSLARVANAGLVIFGLALVVILGTGGTRLELGFTTISLHRAWIPFQFFALFAALRLLVSKRSSGLEGMLVTAYARQGLPPRDTPASVASAARVGALLGAGLGFAAGCADVARVALAIDAPGGGVGGLGLGGLAVLLLSGLGLGVALGALAGVLAGLAVIALGRAFAGRLGRYEAGRWTLALLVVLAPTLARLAPEVGPAGHLPTALLGALLAAIVGLFVAFVLLPSTVLRARVGRWGLAVVGGGVLALVAGLTALGVFGASLFSTPGEGSSYPNVLVVSISGLRADHVGAYGGAPSLTPVLDQLSFSGTRLASAVAPSSALAPSAASMLTGRYPAAHRLREPGGALVFLDEGLPGVLASHGYRTAAFVSARELGGRPTRFSELFDAYADLTTLSDWVRRLALSALVGFGPHGEGPEVTSARVTVERFRSWLQAGGEGPWFAWVQLADPLRAQPLPGGSSGAPLPAPPPWASEDEAERSVGSWRSGYHAALARADAGLGELLALLDARGERPRTLVVVIAEHGLPLGEGGHWLVAGRSLHEAVLHVPWVLTGPGIRERGVVEGPASLVDLPPTLLGLVGLSMRVPSEGEDLSRYLVPQRLASRDTHAGPVFSESPADAQGRRARAVRLGPFKLIRGPEGDEQLYFVDRGRQTLLSDTEGRRERLREKLADMLTRRGAREAQREPGPSS